MLIVSLLRTSTSTLSKRFSFALLLLFATLAIAPSRASAQFSGTIAGGINGATNTEGIDTTSPDLILQPAITLEYMTQFSPITTFKFSFSHAPEIYTVAPDHTITTTTYGIGAAIYLSNLDAIKREWNDAKSSESDVSPLVANIPVLGAIEDKLSDTTKQTTSTSGDSSKNTSKLPKKPASETAATGAIQATPLHSSEDQEIADSIVGEVTTTLYAVSESLDSIKYNGKNADALSDLRDSASETVSTLADVLDSIPFSVSVKEVALDELKDVLAVIEQATSGLRQHDLLLSTVHNAISLLRSTLPQSDYLPVKEEIPVQASAAPTGSLAPKGTSVKADTAQSKTKASLSRSAGTAAKSNASEVDDIELNAPVYTLLNATEQFRNLTFQDFDIVENIGPLAATTFAMNLQTPCTFELDRNRPEFKVYDFNALTLEGTLEASASKSVVLDLTYDFVASKYLNDSIFTNNENRARLGIRALLSKSTTFYGEFIAGLKNYSTQIYFPDSVVVPGKKIKELKLVPLGSNFQLYVFGAGLTHFFGKDANFGGLLDFSASPNLRVFVSQVSNRARQQAAGITDDEYTYQMSRLSLFTNDRIFWSLDFGLDVTGEKRKYGSVLAKDNAAIINETGADRKETDLFIHANLSRTFTYDDERALSLFDLITVELALSYSHVTATGPLGRALPLYSYKDTEGTLTLTLGF